MCKILDNSKINQRGLTLIEVTILFLIIGLLLIPLLHIIDLHKKRMDYHKVQGNQQIIENALLRFVERNGRYPYPAKRDITFGDPEFGHEKLPTLNCTGDSSGDPGPCIVNGARDPDGSGSLNPSTNARVFIGDIPFADLGLPTFFIISPYGGKFTYAISESMTKPSFDDRYGVIQVNKEAGTLDEDIDKNVHYVILSHGENNAGAFSIDGKLISPCQTGLDETVNCDNSDAIFSNNYHEDDKGTPEEKDDVWLEQISMASGPRYFDDRIVYSDNVEGNRWRRSVDGRDIFSGLGEGNFVLMSDEEDGTLPLAKLTVVGNILAERLEIHRLCSLDDCVEPGNPNGYDLDQSKKSHQFGPGVLSPAVITDTPLSEDADKPGGGVSCGTKPMLGIVNADEDCSDQINSEDSNTQSMFNGMSTACNTSVTGKYPSGISGGHIVCSLP